jgi:hypothetical protein
MNKRKREKLKERRKALAKPQHLPKREATS